MEMSAKLRRATKIVDSENSNVESKLGMHEAVHSQEGLQNVAPEIQNLLDMFVKQNKSANGDTSQSDFGQVVTKKEVISSDDKQETNESLTLYATNDESSTAKPQVIQFDPELFKDYMTYMDISQMGVQGSYLNQTTTNTTSPNYPTTQITNNTKDAETSLNSSGYISANSPIESNANSPDSDPLSLPSPVQTAPGNAAKPNRYNIPPWLCQVYPELYQVWQSISASEFYQGGVELLCSVCKTNSYSGFHENLPICEADRIGRACTVCRLRASNGFSYGLALCEADRLFLYRTLAQETRYNKCETPCAVTVQKWCGYCRFRACLSTRGFRFVTEASSKVYNKEVPTNGESRKRKYSDKGIVKELNFIADFVPQDAVLAPSSSSPRPEFGVPTSAQAQQALGVSNSSSKTLKTENWHPPLSQSLVQANPTLVQALNQPISTSGLDVNTSHQQVTNFARPSFNLRPGMSKSEMSSIQSRGPTISQPSVLQPQIASLANSQHASQDQLFNNLGVTTNSRATSTPIPTTVSSGQKLNFPSPSNTPHQMRLQDQVSPSLLYSSTQHPGAGIPQLNRPQHSSQYITTMMKTSPLSTTRPSYNSANQQRLYHQPYSPYPQQVRQQVPMQYFNGSGLGTRNNSMSGQVGSVGVLMDPVKQEWVWQQQEKYLKYHLKLYQTRGK